jgi:AcrR family transcriptional regulator
MPHVVFSRWNRAGLRGHRRSVNTYCMSDSLHGTRVQAIVKRVGVNERMIYLYHHFGSKEGLYAAVIDEQRAGLGSAWAPVLERAATLNPYDGMRAALAGFFDILRSRPRLLALMCCTSRSAGPGCCPCPPPTNSRRSSASCTSAASRTGSSDDDPRYGDAVSAVDGAISTVPPGVRPGAAGRRAAHGRPRRGRVRHRRRLVPRGAGDSNIEGHLNSL